MINGWSMSKLPPSRHWDRRERKREERRKELIHEENLKRRERTRLQHIAHVVGQLLAPVVTFVVGVAVIVAFIVGISFLAQLSFFNTPSEPTEFDPYLDEVCDIGLDRLERCYTYDIRDGSP